MAQAQEHAEMSLEDAKGAIARGLAKIPKVAAAYGSAENGAWDITVLHDYDDALDGISHVSCALNEIMRKAPPLYIRSMIRRASSDPPDGRGHEDMIYERQ